MERILVLTPGAPQQYDQGITDAQLGLVSPLSGFMQLLPTPFVAKLRKPSVGLSANHRFYVRLVAYSFLGLSEGA